MRDLDETDLEILQLLMEDARRPFRNIADIVDLSPPAVSDRVTRLQELGIIRRFTIDIDRSQLHEGVPVLLELHLDPATVETVREALRTADPVEQLLVTAESHLVCQCYIPDGDVREWLSETIDLTAIDEYTVTMLSDVMWTPSIKGTDFALTCAECGNHVTANGVSTRIGDELYQFCCPLCETRFEEQHEHLQENAVD